MPTKKSLFPEKRRPRKLYIEAVCTKGEESAQVIVRSEHTHICFIEKNGKILFEEQALSVSEEIRNYRI